LEGLTNITGFIFSWTGQSFQSKLPDRVKLRPVIAKVCKCFTTEKQIFRYNQIITRIAVYQGLDLKTASCEFTIYEERSCDFQKVIIENPYLQT
jgi:hypothetical protein